MGSNVTQRVTEPSEEMLDHCQLPSLCLDVSPYKQIGGMMLGLLRTLGRTDHADLAEHRPSATDPRMAAGGDARPSPLSLTLLKEGYLLAHSSDYSL